MLTFLYELRYLRLFPCPPISFLAFSLPVILSLTVRYFHVLHFQSTHRRVTDERAAYRRPASSVCSVLSTSSFMRFSRGPRSSWLCRDVIQLDATDDGLQMRDDVIRSRDDRCDDPPSSASTCFASFYSHNFYSPSNGRACEKNLTTSFLTKVDTNVDSNFNVRRLTVSLGIVQSYK